MATVINTSAPHGHLDETVVPGTVHLIDIDGNVRGRHASGRNTDGMYHIHSPIQTSSNWSSLVVLVPAPSNDPDDPLNWSPRRKLISTLALSTYTLVTLPFPRHNELINFASLPLINHVFRSENLELDLAIDMFLAIFKIQWAEIHICQICD